MDLRIVFMGSPDFALPTLDALHAAFNLVGVVTQPDRPAGRGRKMIPPDVKVRAQELDLPLIQPKTLKDPDALTQLEKWQPDVIVVAAFGQILRENVLSLPDFGCVNVHASLLPRWRGAAPVQAAVLHDDVTGVTIMRMDQGLDTGPILSQKPIPIPEDMTAGECFGALARLGADLLVETLPKYVQGELQPQPQEDALATYAPRLQKEDGKLDFNQPADLLALQVRAHNPWPGAYHYFNNKRLKVHRAHFLDFDNAQSGKRYIMNEKPAWGASEGLLVLDEVQLAGKSRMSGMDFLHGAKDWINEDREMEQ